MPLAQEIGDRTGVVDLGKAAEQLGRVVGDPQRNGAAVRAYYCGRVEGRSGSRGVHVEGHPVVVEVPLVENDGAVRISRAGAVQLDGASLVHRVWTSGIGRRRGVGSRRHNVPAELRRAPRGVRCRGGDERSRSDDLGQGDAEAAKHYKKLEADPELAMFLRNREALKKILGSRTTFVVPTDVGPFTLLKGMPELKPVEPNEPEE